jgi:ribosomal protein S12 methylthiotransferase accessory factor
MLNPELHAFYNPESEIDGEVLVDLNSGNVERGVCTLPYQRVRDGATTYLGDTPDFPFVDWNFSNTTEEDYQWLVDCIHRVDKDIYVADFSEQGAYSCRILVPGFSEIYPVEDLEWENNSIGNAIRPKLVRLHELSEQECADLLEELQTMNLNDERPLWEILGLAIPLGTPWKQLRIGELKTLLALAVGDEDAILEGCDWIHHFKDLAPARRLVYRCIESMLNVDAVENYRRSMELLYGLETLGPDMEGSPMHQTLLAAYDKLFA